MSVRRWAAVDRMRSTRVASLAATGLASSGHRAASSAAGATSCVGHRRRERVVATVPPARVRDGDITLAELVGRADLAEFGEEAIESAAIEIRYEGYIERQMREVERASRSERLEIPQSLLTTPLQELSSEGT